MQRVKKIMDMLEKDPKDNFLRHALAMEYISEGKVQEAKVLFEEILLEHPDFIGSYYQLGKLLEGEGEYESAIFWYKKGMEAAKNANEERAYRELKSAYEEMIF